MEPRRDAYTTAARPAVKLHEREHDGPDPRHLDAGSPGGFGAGADGVDVAAEARPRQQEGLGDDDHDDDGDDPRNASDRGGRDAPVQVADVHQHGPGDAAAPTVRSVMLSGGTLNPWARRRAVRRIEVSA